MAKRAIRPKACQVCGHLERHRIELLQVGGASLDSLAKKFGVSRDSVHRHMRNHVDPEMKANYLAGPVGLHNLAQRASEEGVSLLDYLSIIRSTLFRQFDAAASTGDVNGTVSISGRILEVLREIGKLTGELTKLAPNVQINNTLVMQSPAFLELTTTIMVALRPFPEARAVIISELQRIDDLKRVEVPRAPKTIEGVMHHVA